MQLTVATGNPGKLVEFQRILVPLGIEPISLPQLGITLDVEETGTTFAENAKLKALNVFRSTGLPAVADDSGLCVDALNGAPGIYSARYCGEETDYPTKINSLLAELKGVHWGQRRAQFVCAIACVLEEDLILECSGVCAGIIGQKPVGTGGFGYDPVFMLGGRSMAQLEDGEKDKISHRGKALRQLAKELAAYLPCVVR